MQPQSVIPQLRIANAEKSLAFYVDGLGFSVDWKHQFEPGFPLFFQITRAAQTIFLSEHAGDCEVGGAVYFLVPDVDACYSAFLSRGMAFSKLPEDTPWGTREMSLIDPDGNRLRFASERSAA
jgi:catechol 2,3-dioxygenase-like lactoylglutathione lyase family enzyme